MASCSGHWARRRVGHCLIGSRVWVARERLLGFRGRVALFWHPQQLGRKRPDAGQAGDENRGGGPLGPSREPAPVDPALFHCSELPFFLNGVFTDRPWLGELAVFVVFVWGGAIVYLFLFNRRTRQSLHDLICGTFVVRKKAGGRSSSPANLEDSFGRSGHLVRGSVVARVLGAPAWQERGISPA